MNRVKLISKALAFVMAIQLLGDGVFVFAKESKASKNVKEIVVNENNLAPVIKNVTVNKTEFKPGETISITADVENGNLEGIVCKSNLYLNWDDSGNNYINLELKYNETNKNFEGSIKVTEELKYRTIYLSSVEIYDKDGQYVDYWGNNGQVGEIKISDSEGKMDITAPVFESFELDKTEAKVGDVVKATVRASDDLSGIRNIGIGLYLGNFEYKYVLANKVNDEYVADIDILDDLKGKNLTIKYININDKIGNCITVESELKNNIIYVENSSGSIDKVPPTIVSADFNKNVAKVGEEFVFEVDVTDDISEIFTGKVMLNNGEYSQQRELTYNKDSKKLELRLVASSEEEIYKSYEVYGVEVYDESGNRENKEYSYNQYPTVKVVDKNGLFDETKPTYEGIHLSSNKLKVGDTLTVGISASDDLSGIDYIDVSYKIGEEWHYNSSLKLNTENNRYEFGINVTEEMKYKRIKIDYIRIQDKANNYMDYYFGYDDEANIAYIADENGQVDMNAPMISGIEYSHKDVIGIGEILKITADVIDNETEVKEVKLSYQIGGEYKESLIGEFNNSTGKYEFNIEVLAEDVYKNIVINSIYAKDIADNSNYEYDDKRISVKDSDGNIDIEKPVYLGGSFDKEVYDVGDTAVLSLNVNDKLSGIKSVRADIEVGNQNTSNDLIYNEVTAKYEYKIKITDEMIYKKIDVNSIRIVDNAGNEVYLWNDEVKIKEAYVKDLNGEIDSTAPQMVSFEADKETVKVGESVTYSIEARDELSGIGKVSLSYSVAGSNSWYHNELIYNESTKKYEFKLNITEDMLYKKILIKYINVLDNAGNETRINEEEITTKNVTVVDDSGVIDEEAPVFNSIKLNSNTVKVGEKLIVYVDAIDKGVGIENIRISINTPDNYLYENMSYDEKSGKYILEIDIVNTWVYGKIQVNNLVITDKAGNRLDVEYRSLQSANAIVVDESGLVDEEAPLLEEFNIDKEYVSPGESLKITAKVIDELSGVKVVRYSYRIGNEYREMELSYNSDTGLYEGVIEIAEEDKYKKIYSSAVYVRDNVWNSNSYYKGEFIIYITDKDGNMDNQIPKIYSVEFDKGNVKPGESVKILVKAGDDYSGVNEVRVSYSLLGEYKYSQMVYNAETKLYELIIETDNTMDGKTIAINSISVSDNALNTNYISYIRKVILISNTIDDEDLEAPQFISGEVSKGTAKVGDKVKVSVDATDNMSGIEYMNVVYGPFNYSNEHYVDSYIRLEYSESSKKYEGEVLIREYMEGAKLYVDEIYIVDKVNNFINVTDERVNSMSILVPDSLGNVDIEAPIVEAFYLSKNEAKVGEKVKVYFKVNDDNPLKIVELYYGEQWEGEIVTLTFNKISGLYEGEIEINQYMENKMLQASYYYILDSGGNMPNGGQFESIDLSKLNIKVANSKGEFDITPPELKEYKIIETEYTKYINILCNEVGSGIRSGKIVYETERGEEIIFPLNRNYSDDSLQLNIEFIGSQWAHEKLIAKEIVLNDNAGNTKKYTNEEKDFSTLDIIPKDYLKYNKGDVTISSVNNESKEILGTTVYKNHIVRLVIGEKIIDEVRSDANGNFKFDLNYYWNGYSILVQVINPVTKKVVAFEKSGVVRNVDFNLDGAIDILDLAEISSQYGKTNRNMGYDEKLDLHLDGRIDLFDLVYLAKLIE